MSKDQDNLKNAQLEAESLNKELQHLDTAVLGNVLPCTFLCFFIVCLV